jgi:hypothetical protein
MAGEPWFRMTPSRRVRPATFAGWFVTLLLIAIEFGGGALLILVPEALHEPIRWDRAAGWFLLAAGNIAFFIMLSYAKLAPETPQHTSGR